MNKKNEEESRRCFAATRRRKDEHEDEQDDQNYNQKDCAQHHKHHSTRVSLIAECGVPPTNRSVPHSGSTIARTLLRPGGPQSRADRPSPTDGAAIDMDKAGVRIIPDPAASQAQRRIADLLDASPFRCADRSPFMAGAFLLVRLLLLVMLLPRNRRSRTALQSVPCGSQAGGW